MLHMHGSLFQKGMEIDMKVYFYDTRLTEDFHTILVKENAFEYNAGMINTPEAAVQLADQGTPMRFLAEERCYIIAMNTACRPLGMFFLSKGSVNQSLIGIREIFIRALLIGASHIILIHNHPSGNCTPSNSDVLITKKLEEAGDLLGIPLSDHIIIGKENFYSFKDHDMP